MKVLFHHEPFDSDVSSGTLHAAYQWGEMLAAFGVTEAAVIIFDGESWPDTNSDLPITEYATAEEFSAANPGATIIGTAADAMNNYRGYDYSGADWIYIGGSYKSGLVCDHSVSIPTIGGRELYPREAAAIIIAEAAS